MSVKCHHLEQFLNFFIIFKSHLDILQNLKSVFSVISNRQNLSIENSNLEIHLM